MLERWLLLTTADLVLLFVTTKLQLLIIVTDSCSYIQILIGADVSVDSGICISSVVAPMCFVSSILLFRLPDRNLIWKRWLKHNLTVVRHDESWDDVDGAIEASYISNQRHESVGLSFIFVLSVSQYNLKFGFDFSVIINFLLLFWTHS